MTKKTQSLSRIEKLTVTRIGNSDDVIVSGLVDGAPLVRAQSPSGEPLVGDEGQPIMVPYVEVHVWYSHLYGENEGSLHGDKKAIRAYVEQELIAAAPPANTSIDL